MVASTCYTYAKGACGATNSSKFSLHLCNILGVRLLLLLCTSILMSNLFTIIASPFFFTWTFTDGHMVLTNRSKLLSTTTGHSYRACTAGEYHSRDTKVHECRDGCEFLVRDRMEKTWISISGGKPSERCRLVSRLNCWVSGSSILRRDVIPKYPCIDGVYDFYTCWMLLFLSQRKVISSGARRRRWKC